MRQFLFIGLIFLFLVVDWQPGNATPTAANAQEQKHYFVFSPEGKYLVKVYHIENSTWVEIFETGQMMPLTQWQIPDFKAHTVRFSVKDPTKLLLADADRLLVYRLLEEEQKLLFFKPRISGQEIVQAYFDTNNDEIVWATRNTVYKTDTGKNSQQEMVRVPWEQGRIKSVTSLGQGDLALILEDSNKIQLLSPATTNRPVELKAHQKPIVGIQSQDSEKLISIDSDYRLIIWNTVSKEPVQNLKLKKPKEDTRMLGFTLDDAKKNLQVLSQAADETIGQRYPIAELEKGIVNPETVPMTITTAGNVYSSVVSFAEALPDAETKSLEETSKQQAPPAKKKNTIYQLAKIEAETGHYQAALDLIKQIALDDPEYLESRELKRSVFEAINTENVVTAAGEQIDKGNYKSARILLENALSKNPENTVLKRHLKQVEEKLDDKSALRIVFLGGLLVLILLLGYCLWRFQTLKHGGRPAVVEKLFASAKKQTTENKDERDYRREFIYKLDETRKLLIKSSASDSERRYKNTWMEMTARLNTMEKRARLSDNHLEEFLAELEKIQLTIKKLGAQNETKGGSTFHDEAKAQPNQGRTETKGAGASRQNQEKKPVENNVPDYHAILEVPKNATLEEIKQAYRKKMKEYHPDRHNSSDFEWVKAEADKRTRLVQEAYQKLIGQIKS